jgi:xanthine/CO dehydrogenase XdhC/CoxF family maturation factor
MASVPRASADMTAVADIPAAGVPVSGIPAQPLYPAVRGGLSSLLELLLSGRSRAAGCVLGIVFATAGSTYQKPGALILLDRTGMRHGALSGGCLEPEVEERARRVSDSRSAEVVDFDTRSDEDLLFGSGTGCRGRIRLLLLPQPPDAPLTEALAQLATSAGPLEQNACKDGCTRPWDWPSEVAVRSPWRSRSRPSCNSILQTSPGFPADAPNPPLASEIRRFAKRGLRGRGPIGFC